MKSKRILAVALSILMLMSIMPMIATAGGVGENIIDEPTSDGRSYYYPNTTVELEDGSTYTANAPFTVDVSTEGEGLDLSKYGEVTDEISVEGYTVRKVTDPQQLAELFGTGKSATDTKLADLPNVKQKASKEVEVMVILEDAPLSSDESLGFKVGNKVDSSEYKAAKKVLLSKQKDILGQINTLTKRDTECIANFFIASNGMTVITDRNNIAAINSIEGVKIAFESPVFTVEPDEVFNSAAELQGTMLAWDVGYKGEGTAVAVIDSGLYLAHRAFLTAPTNPKYTKEAIASLLEEYDFNAETLLEGFDANKAYISAKIPFVFDYSQNDADVSHTNGTSAHGTHVAGIVAAYEAANNNDTPGTIGAAPEAQIIPMKVFDGGSATFSDVVLAMEDAIMLGVDAVNLSLGAPAGNDFDEGITEVFDAANAAGINVVVSAGNETNSSMGNRWGNDLALAANPDNGVVGSPGSYASNLTVASVNALRSYQISGSTYLTYGRDPIWGNPFECDFYDQAPLEYKIRTVLGGQKRPLVLMTDWEWDDYDMEGKLVFALESEEISTQEIYDIVASKGAAGMVVVPYNEDDDWAYDMEIESYEPMPAVSCMLWNYTDLLWYIDNNPDFDYMISIPPRYYDTVDGGQISDFSSRGTTQDLRIKPEIAAVGGSVYSTWNYNSYADSSGTSMAAPQVAAAAALVRQYLKAEYPSLSVSQMHDITNAILMSTASQVLVNGIPASPRDQGAGLINIEKAVTATSYITVDGCDKPKIELGDDPDRNGTYTLNFNVVNMSNVEKTYDIGAAVQTERAMSGEIRDGEPIYFMYGEPYKLNSIVSGDTEITVPANGTASASVTITLSDADLAYINECYVNGIYIEGYLTVTDRNEEGMNLSAPFLAFYGDWTKLSLMDLTFGYDTLWQTPVDLNYSSVMPHMALTSINGEPHYLGDNLHMRLNPTLEPYGYVAWDDARSYISPNGDGICDGIEAVYTSVLRNASNVIYKITNTETGEVYYEKELGGWTKYTLSNDGKQLPIGMDEYSVFDAWYGTDAEGNTLPDGTEVYVSIELEMMYRGEVVQDNALTEWGFLCCIDTKAPEINTAVNLQGSGNYSGWRMVINIMDEGHISDHDVVKSTLLNSEVMTMTSQTTVLQRERGGSSSANSFTAGSLVSLYIACRDYAGNGVAYIFDSNNEDDSLVELDCGKDIYLTVGETLNVSSTYDFDPLIFAGLALGWTSTNPEIAVATSTGERTATIEALAVGETVITAAYPRAETSDSVTVHVGEDEYAINASANDGGSITPDGETMVDYRGSQSYVIEADENYHIADVLVDGESVGIVSEYTFENVEAEHSIEVVFAADEFEVVFLDGLTSKVIETRTAAYGETLIPPEAPEHEGYEFVNWVGNLTVTADSYIVAVYAEEEEPPALTHSVVIIDGLSGELIEVQQIVNGQAVVLPEAPEHEGYDFVNWEGQTDNITADGIIIAIYKPEYILGDANMDGEVDASDAAHVLRYVVHLIEADQIDLRAADVDLDGQVTAADASLILRYVVKLIDKLG